MKILLVNTVDVENSIEVRFPPLGLAYIASYLRKLFPDIDVKIIFSDLAKEIRDFKPDLLGISSVTQNYGLATEYAKIGKEYGLPVIIGGSHITSMPSTMSSHMDIAVLGEGELTIGELVGNFYNADKNIDACKNISGIAYKEGGQLKITSPRAEILHLDTIPFPARDLLPLPKSGIIHLFSSRGCPYKCQFCVSTRFWNKLRFFSADYVIDEIDSVVASHNPITIGFYDDLFIASKKRLEEIAEHILRKGYRGKLEFILNGRANLITEETAGLLKKMNVVAVNMGLESGSAKILTFLKGTTGSVEQNMRAVDILYRHGINTHGTFIIGSPGETEKDIQETEAFIRKSKLSSFEVYLLVPYPGTPIWNLAEEKGLVSSDMDWGRLVQESIKNKDNKILMADHISREKLLYYYKRLQLLKYKKRFFSRLRTIIRNPKRVIPAIKKNISNRRELLKIKTESLK